MSYLSELLAKYKNAPAPDIGLINAGVRDHNKDAEAHPDVRTKIDADVAALESSVGAQLSAKADKYTGTLVRLYNSAQSIANNSQTIITFNDIVYNELGAFNAGAPTKLTVPAGVTKVQVYAFSRWDQNSTGMRMLIILKNGAYPGGLYVTNPAASRTENTIISPILNVAPGDYFTVSVYQSSGGALNFAGDTNITPYFCMMKVE